MRAPRQRLWMPVVAGLMRRDGQVLLGLRPGKDPTSGYWEFPGGKVEPGETPQLALVRELKEELGIEAQVGRIAFVTTHQYEALNILLLFFHIDSWKGELKKVHHEDLRWLALSELKDAHLLPANRKCIPEILEALRG